MKLAALAGAAALAAGCASTRYRWGDYDEALYAHYKRPQEKVEFVQRLAALIASAEQAGGPVPPGCYAEYGYALLEAGDFARAIDHFEKERKAWPESAALMEKMIKVAERQARGRAGS